MQKQLEIPKEQLKPIDPGKTYDWTSPECDRRKVQRRVSLYCKNHPYCGCNGRGNYQRSGNERRQ